MKKAVILFSLLLTLPIIVFAQTQLNDCMVQQKIFKIKIFGEKEITAPLYWKNDIPMIAVESRSSWFATNVGFNGNKVTVNNKVYSLLEVPDTINNQLFVPADFFSKVWNMPLCIDFKNRRIVVDWNSWETINFDVNSSEEIDYNSMTLTESCTLFQPIGFTFYIQIEGYDVEGDIAIFSDNSIALINESSYTPFFGTITNVRVVDSVTGVWKDEARMRKPKTIRTWHFKANEAGESVIAIKGKEFTIIVFDKDICD